MCIVDVGRQLHLEGRLQPQCRRQAHRQACDFVGQTRHATHGQPMGGIMASKKNGLTFLQAELRHILFV
jgi:hypothetical protein